MKHLFSVDDFNNKEIEKLLILGFRYLEELNAQGHGESAFEPWESHGLRNKIIALWFDEPSTRTILSFENAIKHLGGETVRIDQETSSAKKGEDWTDTAHVLAELGCSAVVMRSNNAEAMLRLAESGVIQVINAGAGLVEHPTQALGDLLYLYANHKPLDKIRLGLVGDLLHSRVAHSHFKLLPRFGVQIMGCAPKAWLPKKPDFDLLSFTTKLPEALSSASGVMALRIQSERHTKNFDALRKAFVRSYRLSEEHLRTYPNIQFVMHPGPVIWDVELEGKLKNSKKLSILTQIRTGLAMRMALLHYLIGGEAVENRRTSDL